MSLLAERLGRIKPSPTVAISAKAAEMKAAGENVIGLGAGEPDFDTPDHIVEAGIEAMKQGKTRYAPPAGIPELREAVVEKFKRENGLEYKTEQVTVGCGGKQIVYNAMVSTLNPGDEVIVPAPYWVSYPDITLLCEGTPIVVDCPANANFKLTPEALEKAIAPKTKWLILNSPSNPTGATYSRDDLTALGDVLKRHPQVHVLTDDIYEHIIYDNFIFTTIAQAVPELKDRTLTLNGVSKAFCMTGWRVGYAAGPIDLIKSMNKVTSQSTTSTSTIGQVAAAAALNGPTDFIAIHNAAFKRRRDLVVDSMNAAPGLTCARPGGAFYVYPSCAGAIGKKTPKGDVIASDRDFVAYLLEAEGCATVFGEAFGLSPYFRISYALNDAALAEACARIERACEALA